MVERSLRSNPSSVRLLCRHIQLLHMRSGKDVAAVDSAVSEAVLTTGKEVPAAAVILEVCALLCTVHTCMYRIFSSLCCLPLWVCVRVYMHVRARARVCVAPHALSTAAACLGT